MFLFHREALGDGKFEILFQILHLEGKFSPKYCHKWYIARAYAAFCHQAKCWFPSRASRKVSIICPPSLCLFTFFKTLISFYHHRSLTTPLMLFLHPPSIQTLLLFFYNLSAFILSLLTLPLLPSISCFISLFNCSWLKPSPYSQQLSISLVQHYCSLVLFNYPSVD